MPRILSAASLLILTVLACMPARAEEYAAQLYGKLHEMDREGFDWIAVEWPPGTREWDAVRDRLMRAAYEE